MCDEVAPDNRNLLCLHGYQFLLPLTTGEETQKIETLNSFLQLVVDYEVNDVQDCKNVISTA